MEYIDLADSRLKASRIGLSTCAMSAGMAYHEQRQQAKETIIEALNKGINVIDIGSTGECSLIEETIGRVITEYGNRANVIIVAKARIEDLLENSRTAIDPGKISQALESSLKRLRTDYVDLYEISQYQRPEYFAGMVRSAERFLKEGKVHMLGVDDQSCEPLQIPAGSPAISFAQFPYNMFERSPEDELIPYVQKNKMMAITNRSLCSGLLAGGLRNDTDLEPRDPLFNSVNLPRYLEAVRELESLAAEHFSRKIVHLSIRWLLDRLEDSVVLWGARRPEHLDPVDMVMGWHVDGDACKLIEGILTRAAGEKPENRNPKRVGFGR